MKVTAEMGPADEDGVQTVAILIDGEEVERFLLHVRDARQWVAQEVAIRQAMADHPAATCEHGMSAALCSGPMHY